MPKFPFERVEAIIKLPERSNETVYRFEMSNGWKNIELDFGTGCAGSMRTNCGVIFINHHLFFVVLKTNIKIFFNTMGLGFF